MASLCGSLLERDAAANDNWRTFVSQTILIVTLASLLFLFRRWYVFLTIGVACAATLWLAFSWRPATVRPLTLLARLWLLLCVAVLTLFAMLADVMTDWLTTASQHNYVELYSGYWLGYPRVFGDFIKDFGIVVPVFAVSLCVFLFVRTRRALPFILLVCNIIGICGILTIQSPYPHHYYVLMPLISGSLAAGAIWLASSAAQKLACLSVLALGVIAAGLLPVPPTVLSGLIPAPGLLTPPSREDIPELARIVDWVVANVGADERYCVISSSGTFNITIVENFWQRVPTLRDKMPLSVWLGEVDSRDGPPPPQVGDCNTSLVANPVSPPR